MYILKQKEKVYSEQKKNSRSFLLSRTGGFTLVEMIVAVFVFSIVMLAATGALFSMLEANRKAQTIKTVVNNLNFALESMTRSIRVGGTYHCGSAVGNGWNTPRNCPTNGSTYFIFEGVNGTDDPSDQIHYQLNNAGRIVRSTDNGATFIGLTAPDEVVVEELSFFVSGAEDTDTEQPRVLIIVRGYAGVEEKRVEFNLQTLIAQRAIDR